MKQNNMNENYLFSMPLVQVPESKDELSQLSL